MNSFTESKGIKFKLIGDGLLYYLCQSFVCMYLSVSQIAGIFDIKIFNVHLASQVSVKHLLTGSQLTMAEAIRNIEQIASRQTKRTKKLLISIGVTDIRNGMSLCEMRKEFTTLFLACEHLGYKPLITTVCCYDSPCLNEKAEIFNDFLKDNFDRVFDVANAVRHGFGTSLLDLKKA